MRPPTRRLLLPVAVATCPQRGSHPAVLARVIAWLAGATLGLLLSLAASSALAQETVCARVKIEIKQELTLERQAFDAEMRITNTLTDASLGEVKVDVKVTDAHSVFKRLRGRPETVLRWSEVLGFGDHDVAQGCFGRPFSAHDARGRSLSQG